MARSGPNKGKYEYGLKWNRPFPQTRAETAKRKKKKDIEPTTLKKLYAREASDNQISAGRGTAAINLVHDYIKKFKRADPDIRLQRRGVGSGRKLRQLKPHSTV